MNVHIFDEEVGLLKTGTVVSTDQSTGVISVKLTGISSIKGRDPIPTTIPIPTTLSLSNGIFIGALPTKESTIVLSQGGGGQHYFVSNLVEPSGVNNLPVMNEDELLIRSNENTKITLDLSDNINIGSDSNRIHIDTQLNLITTNFYSSNTFTQATRKVAGIIKRDLKRNNNFSQELKLEYDDSEESYYTIGLDPTVTSNAITSGINKNPPFVESRELIYEFQNLSNVEDELTESTYYANQGKTIINSLPNRRLARTDTLSLTLAAPNHLMESVKGTVVDIFGNILDINRYPLQVGQGQNTLRQDVSQDKSKSYLSIREMQRKSVALHFELNARKDFTGNNGQIVYPDINSNADYARNRSRFSIDVDKEGQFKINVPASSEKGNISLLTRYENYSTFGEEDNNNPNKLIFRDDNLDIFHDSFASGKFDSKSGTYSSDKGSIEILDGTSIATPIDRIVQSHIKHGTAYHDILATCYTHQNPEFLNWQAYKAINVNSFGTVNTIASSSINVSGDKANAGGRSGNISLDGSIELNIGANTVDRQSIWIDTAGGMVANFGKDNKNRSAVMSMDGDVLWQIGGFTVSTDSRFNNKQKAGATLDIRVMNNKFRTTIFRIDDEGVVTVMTPSSMQFHAGQGMRFSSDADIVFDAENVYAQGREIKRSGGTI